MEREERQQWEQAQPVGDNSCPVSDSCPPVSSSPQQGVQSPQNNCVGAGSIFGHGLILLVSTDATSLTTQRPQSTFTAAHILPSCPWHFLGLRIFPGGIPNPQGKPPELPKPGLCIATVSNKELQLITALSPWAAAPRTDCSSCSQ